MSATQQNCNVGSVNTGQACVPIFRAIEKFIFVPTYNSLGVANELDLTAGPFNAAFFAALINNTDPTERWLPTPSLKNLANDRADALTESFDDGSKVYISQGIRSIVAYAIGADASPQMQGKLNGQRGLGMSAYGIDKEGNLVGRQGSTSTMFAPIELESDSIVAILQPTTDKTIQKIKLMFDINISEDDSLIQMIQASELAYNIKNLTGLVDVTAVYSNKTATTLTVKLKTDGGTPLNPVLVKNLVAANFVSSVGGATARIYNDTTNANVTVTAVESPAGSYTLTFAAQTAGDILIIKPLFAGFDFSAVEADTVVAV